MAKTLLRIIAEGKILRRRDLAVPGGSSFEIYFVVESKANFHSALDVEEILTIGLRTVKRYSLFLLTNDATLVRLFRFNPVELDWGSGWQSYLIEPEGTGKVDPPIERFSRRSLIFQVILFFLFLRLFQWRHLPLEEVFFLLYVQRYHVLKS